MRVVAIVYVVGALAFWPCSYRWYPWNQHDRSYRFGGASVQMLLWPLGLMAWWVLHRHAHNDHRGIKWHKLRRTFWR